MEKIQRQANYDHFLTCGTVKVVSVSTLFPRLLSRDLPPRQLKVLAERHVSVSNPTHCVFEPDTAHARHRRPLAANEVVADGVREGTQNLGVGPAVSIRTLLPGDFYLLFPDLVTLGFVFANGEGNSRFDFNGKHAGQTRPVDASRCVERFKGKELSIQIGGRVADRPEPFRIGTLIVSKSRTRHFLVIELSGAQPLLYIDLQDWKLAGCLPDATFDIYNKWKFVRGWDGTDVYEFH